MDNSKFDKQYLMYTPVSFLLKEKNIEEIEQLQDENGWNIIHHAVAAMNISKISEFLHFNMNICSVSSKNHIPEEAYCFNDKKKTNDKLEAFSKIPFSNKGFTPTHLAMFLFNFYQDLSEKNGNDFFYSSICEKYQKIIDLLITPNTIKQNPIDGDGKSLFDYAFLMENINLIDSVNMADPEFKTLHQVDVHIAKKIIEVMEVKYKDGSHEHIKKQLQTKILQQQLSSELPFNQGFQSLKKI